VCFFVKNVSFRYGPGHSPIIPAAASPSTPHSPKPGTQGPGPWLHPRIPTASRGGRGDPILPIGIRSSRVPPPKPLVIDDPGGAISRSFSDLGVAVVQEVAKLRRLRAPEVSPLTSFRINVSRDYIPGD